ncbi:hypothetical protein COL10_03530 [Bacillus cereus]|uniref:hypothetical protein n=1 Tax=Bacillus cereus TaxID=1396 RepID=UPI000BEE21FC|nr:hypothetical protein [Bacillus cereus]PEF92575.1 hypothetical protein CON46_11430 [Bacillus cereus]PFD76438.1 hypothetical protein CN301_05300 [Bacillus cereus]PFV13698.1 hypothetical protein COL10_03530 [Bacillus cereus]PGV45692.1 hypothetical protein COD74_10945 [Bacillus cereus]
MKKLLLWLKFLKNRFKTVRGGMRVLFYIAVAWVVIYEFYLVNIPEWFPKAAVLGIITDKICFAYITAFIFFFVNVHLSGHAQKVKTYRYVRNKAALIRKVSINLMLNIKKANGLDINNNSTPSKEEYIELCKKVDPRGSLQSVGFLQLQFENWFDYMKFIESETKRLIKDLLFIRESLDTDTIKFLMDIEECLERHVNLTKGIYVGNTSLEHWAEGIHNYIDLCQKLIEHLDKKSKEYSEEYHYIEEQKKLKENQQK